MIKIYVYVYVYTWSFLLGFELLLSWYCNVCLLWSYHPVSLSSCHLLFVIVSVDSWLAWWWHLLMSAPWVAVDCCSPVWVVSLIVCEPRWALIGSWPMTCDLITCSMVTGIWELAWCINSGHTPQSGVVAVWETSSYQALKLDIISILLVMASKRD